MTQPIAVLCFFNALAAYGIDIDVNRKSPNDKREFRSIILANKLEALLISDPTYNKSAAAIDVAVGDHEDPDKTLGMAHFLEHVLFLGTKTYPEPDEFAAYLEANQGDWNAYTASESTNFHFDINHGGFDGALQRFSLFFSEPTFNPKFFPKERQAVTSEFKKNMDSDDSRGFAVFQKIIKKDHPASRFSIGNEETLGKASVDDMRRFFEKYYSANRMKLVLMSNLSLDSLEQMAKKYFEAIKNTDRQPNSYSTDYINISMLPAEIHVRSLKDVKELQIAFPIPTVDPKWKTKPHAILGHLLGHEGKGSLLSRLKRDGLASGIYTSIPSSSYGATFETAIRLTDKGLKNTDQVTKLFFAYMKMVKKLGYQRYLYDEEKSMRDINFVYKDKSEGVEVASGFANLMQKFPALEVERRPYLLYEFGEKEFAELVGQITPERMWMTISSNSIKTEKEEHFFKTKYSIEKISKTRLTEFANVELQPDLSYPERNIFIPKSLELLHPKEQKPEKIVDNDFGVFWFQPDNEFNLPKASVNLLIKTNHVNSNPTEKMMANLYASSLIRSLEEWKYAISLAGLSFEVERVDRGINLNFSGYSENIPMLMKTVIGKLKDVNIDETAFADVKNELKRTIANAFLSDAYQQANYHLFYLSDKLMIHPKYYYSTQANEKKIDLISPVALKSVQTYAQSLFDAIAIEGAAYGNLTKESLAEVINSVPTVLNAKPLPKEARKEVESLRLKPGQQVASKLVSDVTNTSWVSSLQFGDRSSKLQAILAVGDSFLKSSFFRELRTKQQLGYVVASWASETKRALGMTFLIQSDQYSPKELAIRSKAWMKESLIALKAMPAQEFNDSKFAVATEFRQKIKTIPERLARIIYEAIYLDGKFGYNEEVAKAAESLTQEEIVKTFEDGFSKEKAASISVYLSTKKTPKFEPDEAIIKNELDFKASSVYR
jgi:insulysin